MPCVGDVAGSVAADGSEYLLGDEATSETDVVAGSALQHVEQSSTQQHKQPSSCLINRTLYHTLLYIHFTQYSSDTDKPLQTIGVSQVILAYV